MVWSKFKTFLKCERGTQMIEFALLLPFLIVLFASSVEMGRMFYTYTTLQKSTEVGARYLSSVLGRADPMRALILPRRPTSLFAAKPAVARVRRRSPRI